MCLCRIEVPSGVHPLDGKEAVPRDACFPDAGVPQRHVPMAGHATSVAARRQAPLGHKPVRKRTAAGTPRLWAIAQAFGWPEEARGTSVSSAEAPRNAYAVIFDVEVDVSAVASSHDEQIDQLLGRELARLQTHGGEAHCLAASRLSCVYVAHVIPSLTCRVPACSAFTGGRRS